MWHAKDTLSPLHYYLDPKLITKGHLLVVDLNSLVSRFLPFDQALTTAQFRFRKQKLIDNVNKGYTLVIIVYDHNYDDNFKKNLPKYTRIIRALNIPVLMLVSHNETDIWKMLNELIQIKQMYYIGTQYTSPDKPRNEIAVKNGATFYWDTVFFGELALPTKPAFDMAQYLNSKQTFNLIFTEPMDNVNKIVTDPTGIIKVNRLMYQSILAGGRYYNIENPYPGYPKQLNGNAFVFGPLFDLKDYQLVSWHKQLHDQTGFLDVDLIKRFGHLYYSDQDPLISLYGEEFDDDPDNRKMVHDYHPQVVWNGYAPVPPSLYKHLDARGEIDSLIVDVNYLFLYEDLTDLQYDLLNETLDKFTFIYRIDFKKLLESSGKYPSPSTLSAYDIEAMTEQIYDSIPRSKFVDNLEESNYKVYAEGDHFYLKINFNLDEGGLVYRSSSVVEITSCLVADCTYSGHDAGFCSQHARDLVPTLTEEQKHEMLQQCLGKAKKRQQEYKKFLVEFYQKGLDNIPDEIEYETVIEDEFEPIKFVKVKLVPIVTE